ncbi:GIY-YIG nuclease family protein [Mesorhizobium sp. M0203]|uniref:GIY-YIG nuclease family protein n=1 Tax=Mesorhizobium sp. M0203 TaxID=2956912 RepID=UPI00333BA7BE
MDSANRDVGIYAIVSEVRDLLYIGSSDHIVRRWIAHRSQLRRGIHHGKWLQRIWAKDGEDTFSFVIIERLSVGADLICREQWWINRLRPALNCDVPAGNPMMGRKHSPSARAKMSAAQSGKSRGPRQFSEAAKQAMSRAAPRERPWLRGRPMSDTQKRKLSECATRRFSDPSFTHPTARTIEIDGTTYRSVKEASRILGVSRKLTRDAASAGHLAPKKDRGAHHPRAKAVVVDGIGFDTKAEAARHFSVTVAAVTYWLTTGRAIFA